MSDRTGIFEGDRYFDLFIEYAKATPDDILIQITIHNRGSDEAKLHVLSHGLHYGGSVFEGERVYEGSVFKLREHSQRLIDSARMLDMEINLDVEDIENATREVVEANGIIDGYVRPIAWRGSGSTPPKRKPVHNRAAMNVASSSSTAPRRTASPGSSTRTPRSAS